MSIRDTAREVFERHPDEPNRYELVDEIVAAIKDQEAALREAVRMLVPSLSAAPRRASLRKVVGVSAKQQMIRSEWDEFLSQSLPVGEGRYILVGDATVADLRAAAGTRRMQAEALVIEAERWESIAAELEASGAECLRDMPIGSVTAAA